MRNITKPEIIGTGDPDIEFKLRYGLIDLVHFKMDSHVSYACQNLLCNFTSLERENHELRELLENARTEINTPEWTEKINDILSDYDE